MLQRPCVTVTQKERNFSTEKNEWKINKKVFGRPYKVTMRMG